MPWRQLHQTQCPWINCWYFWCLQMVKRTKDHPFYIKVFPLFSGIFEHLWLGLCPVHSKLRVLQHDAWFLRCFRSKQTFLVEATEVQHIWCLPCSHRGDWTRSHVANKNVRQPWLSPGLWTGVGILSHTESDILRCLCGWLDFTLGRLGSFACILGCRYV